MDRLIGRSSYWAGVACAVLAILWRIGNALSFLPASLMRHGIDVSYWSCVHIAFLLFIVTMATASYTWLANHKSD